MKHDLPIAGISAVNRIRDGHRTIIVPTQVGCSDGCHFCEARTTPLVRNLRASEIVSIVDRLLDAPASAGPFELAFTGGPGEALLNLRETRAAALELKRKAPSLSSVCYGFTGIGASRLLSQVPASDIPTRLQFALHAARQGVRDRLVPRSSRLATILEALRQNADRFMEVELHVVLQGGVNDTPEDLSALLDWGERSWPIVLGPTLVNGREALASRAWDFEAKLRLAGRRVRRHSGSTPNPRPTLASQSPERSRSGDLDRARLNVSRQHFPGVAAAAIEAL